MNMGGLAFTKGPYPLYTPRMPCGIYEYVRRNCHAILRELFVIVATPIEGPGKSDFGDIDIFVTLRKEEYFGGFVSPIIPGAEEKYPFDTIKELLGAERKIQERNNIALFAIPWPSSLPEHLKDTPATSETKPRFIQVDIHICPSLSNLEWFLFKHAHGDLWNLLGSIIRPYGLTVDEVGLYIRVPEIEKQDRKKAKVLLTTDPFQVLSFLGLDFQNKQWEEKIDSVEEVFQYAATSRFFQAKPATGEDEDADTSGDREVGGEFRKSNLKSNDRKRMAQRPLFRKWIEEFLPKCREGGRFVNSALTREETTEQAFGQFGVRNEYEARLVEFHKERQRQTLWKEIIKPAIPTDLDVRFRSIVASTMKKIIMQNDKSFGIQPEESLRDEQGLFLEDTVRRWVEDNWREVGTRVMLGSNNASLSKA